MEDLPKWFSIIFLADVGTMLLSLFMIGDFPHTNPMYVDFTNTCIGWIFIKSIVYCIIMLAYKYNKNHNFENIFAIICIMYGCLAFYNIHQIYIQPVEYSISPNFTSSLHNFSPLTKNPTFKF
jgi:hypothetical protein